MYDLKIYPDFTIAGIERKIVFFSSDGTVLHEIALPQKSVADESKVTGDQRTNGNQPSQPALVVTFEYCPSSKLFAVSLNDKSLRCYRLDWLDGVLKSEPVGEVVSTTRTIVCMKFGPKHGVLFGSDKSDCFEFTLPSSADKKPKWILGHMSQILSLAVSEDERFLITCDRDEKIKISSYPDCHNIVCFCLGHLEYVGGMEIASNGNLISVSGDKTLRLWDYSKGKELFSHTLENPAVALSIRAGPDGTLCAVQSSIENKLEVVHISHDIPTKCDVYDAVTLDASFTILNAALNANTQLILLVMEKESKRVELKIYDFVTEKRQFVECREHAMRANFENHFKEVTIFQVRDYSTLFKNSIDNLSEYFERKKIKIESKSKTK